MATPKQYAFYIKGNKLCVAQKNTSFNNDPNSRNYGADSKDVQWESPLENIEGGLEIEYSYAPTYNILLLGDITNSNNNTQSAAMFGMFGWTVIDGYLSFVHGKGVGSDPTYTDFSNSAYNEELTGGDISYILIEGSNRWSGIHEIKARGSQGYIQTTTKVPGVELQRQATVDINDTTFEIDDDNIGNSLTRLFSNTTNPVYFFMRDSSNSVANNNQNIYKASFDGDYTLTVSDALYINSAVGATNITGDGFTWGEKEISDSTLDDASNGVYLVNRIYRDECRMYAQTAFTTMKDETFELDLPDYQSRAIVLYLKAKLMEDTGDLDKHEYYMREFKRQVEKYSSSRGSSFRQVQGFWGLR